VKIGVWEVSSILPNDLFTLCLCCLAQLSLSVLLNGASNPIGREGGGQAVLHGLGMVLVRALPSSASWTKRICLTHGNSLRSSDGGSNNSSEDRTGESLGNHFLMASIS